MAKRSPSLLRSIFPPLSDWRAALPAFGWSAISGVIFMLAHRPLNLSILALVALVPLFWGLRRCKPMMAFYVSLIFGSIHGLMFTYWLTSVSRFNPAVYAGIPPLALWWGAHLAVGFAIIVYFARNLSPWMALFAAMMAWVGLEYFRMVGRLGIPYGLFGHSFGGWNSMAQNASLLGLPFLGALIIGVNLCFMETLAAFKAKYGHVGALLRLGMMLTLVVVGHINGARIISATEELYSGEESFTVRLALVQTGIDQDVKFASYGDSDQETRLRLQDEIMASLIAQLESIEPGSVDLVLTPESSMTSDIIDVEYVFQQNILGGAPLLEIARIATEIEAPIIVGAVDNVFLTADGEWTESLHEGLDDDMTIREGYKTYGAFWLVQPGETSIRPVADYRKVKLMPFGETVPYFDMIPGFQEGVVGIGSFASAKPAPPIGMLVQRDSLSEPVELRLGPSICFEDLFPDLHRRYSSYGAHLFVNTTNDAWFDGSSGPYWHQDAARWRSIEFRTPMVRSTNSGLTCVIDATGRTVETLPLLTKDVLLTEVSVVENPPRTLYSRVGYIPALLCFLGTIALLVGLRMRREP